MKKLNNYLFVHVFHFLSFLLFYFHVENRLHQIASSPNGVIASPTRQIYASNEPQLHNQMQQRQQPHQLQPTLDTRLPPDLLPYAQHQVYNGSLNNSSSSGSSTATTILEHRHPSYSSTENAFATYTNSEINETDQELSSAIDEPDLRIYHNDSFTSSTSALTTGKVFGFGSAMTTTIATGKTTTTSLTLSKRTANYELASTSTNCSTNSFSKSSQPFYSSTIAGNQSSTSNLLPHQSPLLSHSVKATADYNGGTMHWKPRQSIVRASPSFSFLSTGYNQQQDNFL